MKRICIALSAALCCLISCTLEPIPANTEKTLVEIENVSMIAHNFKYENSIATKTALNDKMEFSWSSDDVVGVFPNWKILLKLTPSWYTKLTPVFCN